MPKLKQLVKDNPLETKAGRCICGLRLQKGSCRHCDSVCERVLLDPRGCKRCAENVQNFLHKDFIRRQYFAIIDEEIELGTSKIRLEALKNDYPDFLKPDGGDSNE